MINHDHAMQNRILNRMEEKRNGPNLASFEKWYRTKSGSNVGKSIKSGNGMVSDSERKRKTGAGRKAATYKNIYFHYFNPEDGIIKDEELVMHNIDNLIYCAQSLHSDENGRACVSSSVILKLIKNKETLSARDIIDELSFGKTQAYRILKVWKFIMNMDLNLVTGKRNSCI